MSVLYSKRLFDENPFNPVFSILGLAELEDSLRQFFKDEAREGLEYRKQELYVLESFRFRNFISCFSNFMWWALEHILSVLFGCGTLCLFWLNWLPSFAYSKTSFSGG